MDSPRSGNWVHKIKEELCRLGIACIGIDQLENTSRICGILKIM
jgi:hypothetical protein